MKGELVGALVVYFYKTAFVVKNSVLQQQGFQFKSYGTGIKSWNENREIVRKVENSK